jgi:hypothetical protein
MMGLQANNRLQAYTAMPSPKAGIIKKKKKNQALNEESWEF